MGEFATRKIDNERIKIGTCESMYYIRWEHCRELIPDEGNVNPATCDRLFFRLPLPEEDSILPGGYDNHTASYRLIKEVKNDANQYDYDQYFEDPETAKHPGIIQLRHESGVLLNVPCYHGVRLPDPPPGGNVHFNGKTYSPRQS